MGRTFSFYIPTLLLCLSIQIQTFGSVFLWLFDLPPTTNAYAAGPPTTISATPAGVGGLNTLVNSSQTTVCSASCVITGGTRPGGGGNLFHSFGQFNIGAGDIATFQNGISFNSNGTALPAGLPTSNILARITGTNGNNPTLSSIYGTLQTSGFGNANLFLMNPAGFLFGPSATVNVGGMVSFTSADYLKLGDGKLFNALPNPNADALLSSMPVAAYGFLGSNPGAITIQGSQLTVTPGQSISLVGGNIAIQSGTPDGGPVQSAKLSAPGGQINLASVASPGEILAGTLNQAPNINGQSFGALGTVQVLEQSHIDVSGNGGGTVLIRGGNFVLDSSTISANVTGPGSPNPNTGGESIGGGIDIQVTDKVLMNPGSLLETNMLGNATPGVTYGGTHIKADRVEIIGDPGFDAVNGPFTQITSNVASGSTGGNSGSIKLESKSLYFQDFVSLQASTQGAGNSGDIIIHTTGNLELNGSNFLTSSGDLGAPANSVGNAGNIELTSTNGNILMTNGVILLSSSVGSGTVGHITVNAPAGDVLLSNFENFETQLVTNNQGSSTIPGTGGIQITAKNLTIADSGMEIDNFTSVQPGDLTVNLAGRLSITNDGATSPFPSPIVTTTRGAARSANLNITAQDILLSGNTLVATDTYKSGNAGTLNIFTQTLEVTNGAQIRSGSLFNPALNPADVVVIPSGAAGTITIQGQAGPAQSVLVDGTGSSILTNTVGTGAGGSINISTNSLTVQNGGTLSAATSGTASSATGGTITVKADTVTLNTGGTMTAASTGPGASGEVVVQGLASTAQSIVIDGAGSGIFTDTQSTGAGGDIHLFANSVTLQNGGTLSATTSGTSPSAIGGSISVNATDVVTMTNGGLITASSTGPGNAGNISINAGQQLQMQNSSIKTEAAQAGGGNINIQAVELIRAGNSKISTSVLGGGGSGGNITIDPNIVLLENSQILAQAVQGAGGNISITANLLLADINSTISASSQFGQQGTISIQSPISPASGKILPLSNRPLIATSLTNQRCAALAGGNFSSFTIAGRDSLPAEPGGWLSTPLALASSEPGGGTLTKFGGSLREGESGEETPLLSLRQIAPPGFLTQTFAVESSAGCTS